MGETKEEQTPAMALYGQYKVPSLAGVEGDIEFIGPKGRVHMRIDDECVTISPSSGKGKADVVISADDGMDLVRLVGGELNVGVAALQDRVEASGDLVLALKVAGSMPELARQAKKAQADKAQAEKGGK